jgi:hypothetical protein
MSDNRFGKIKLCCMIVISLFGYGCATTSFLPKPAQPENVCEIFRERPLWYQDAISSRKKWNIPISVMMAIMYQESSFRADARPPRTWFLFIFPGPYPSTAYGYSQALDNTWEEYKQNTGNRDAERDNFADAVDFIGWYCSLSAIRSGIVANDPYNLYLAYCEGHGGFNRQSYKQKAWLMNAARRVEDRSKRYSQQMAYCDTGR